MFGRWKIAGFNVKKRWQHGSNIAETSNIHQYLRWRIDASLMLMMATFMNDQRYQCVLDWGDHEMNLKTNPWLISNFDGSFITDVLPLTRLCVIVETLLWWSSLSCLGSLGKLENHMFSQKTRCLLVIMPLCSCKFTSLKLIGHCKMKIIQRKSMTSYDAIRIAER